MRVFMHIGNEIEALGPSLAFTPAFKGLLLSPPHSQYAHTVQLPESVSPSKRDPGSEQRAQDTKPRDLVCGRSSAAVSLVTLSQSFLFSEPRLLHP